MPSAYLLISHGSRDPRPQAAVEHLAKLMCEKMRVRGDVCLLTPCNVPSTMALAARSLPTTCLLSNVYLELAPLPLHEQIQEFGKQALAFGYKRLQVLPLFLLPGVHVMEDIPAEIAIAQQAMGSELQIDIRPYLGSHPGLGHLLANQLAPVEPGARILLSHGSRRAGGNQPVEAIAATLQAMPAYWSVPPNLESRLLELVSAGHNHIEILPYFLFPGGITDAIAQAVAQYGVQFPSINIQLAKPIGASAELADLIWDLTRE